MLIAVHASVGRETSPWEEDKESRKGLEQDHNATRDIRCVRSVV